MRENAAAIDVADQQHRRLRFGRDVHVHDILRGEVHLGGRAGAPEANPLDRDGLPDRGHLAGSLQPDVDPQRVHVHARVRRHAPIRAPGCIPG